MAKKQKSKVVVETATDILRRMSKEWDATLRKIAKLHYETYQLDKGKNHIIPLDAKRSLHLTNGIFSIRTLTGNAPGNGMYHYLRVRPNTKSIANLRSNRKAFSMILETLAELKKNNKINWTPVGREVNTKYNTKDVKDVRPGDYV